jgi:hypothetical protein
MSNEVLDKILAELIEEDKHRADAMPRTASTKDETMLECLECGGDFTNDPLEFDPNNDHCHECLEDLAECKECEELIKSDHSYFHDSAVYCEDCYNDKFSYCEGCSETYANDYGTISPRGDSWYCYDCWQDRYYTCERCEDSGDRDSAYSTNWGSALCGDCYWELYTECEECGETIEREEAYYDDGSESTLCEPCYGNSSSRIIKDYGYKPDPIFYGNRNARDRSEHRDRKYIGVEIEYECKYGKRSQTAETIHEFDEDCERFYQKDDGSLDHGVELVSHPCTLAYHNEQFGWKEILAKLRELQAKSHDTSTCGYHLHMNRSAFTRSQEIKLAMFVKANQRRIEIFCRRRDNEYARFKHSLKPYMRLNRDEGERREVLNFTNRNTIEWRLPKGTLKTSAVLATIQFYHAMVSYTQQASASKLVTMHNGWSEYVLFVNENKKIYPDLMEYMESRGIA